MGIGYSGPEAFVKEPAEARFISEVLAEKAADGAYKYKQSYQALRSLSPQELFEMYRVYRDEGNEAFREAFGPFYHRAAGELVEGPLFEGVS